jgi:pimeloyl-ACP methyl ester carboxylesterase
MHTASPAQNQAAATVAKPALLPFNPSMPALRSKLSFLFLLIALLAQPGCQTHDIWKHKPSSHALRHRSASSPLDYWLQRAARSNDPKKLRLATAKVAEHWRENPDSPTGNFRLEVDSAPQATAHPFYFQHYRSADICDVSGMNTRYTRDGIGAPLIGLRTFKSTDPLAQYHPERGIERAVTAVLTFPQPNHARLTFYDPGKTDSIAGTPLAADFTAPLSNALGNPRHMRRVGLMALLRSGDPNFKAGFLLTQPYDPKKTPLILVHGLLSSHSAWRNVANDLIADPNIRSRYQIWFYHYPTGNPVLVSAEVFRRNLNQLRRDLDPDGNDPAMRHTVVIAHSMGGLLSKTLITTTDDRLWKRAFTVPTNELPLPPQDRRFIIDSFQWKARPEVKRVIYIAVPHRGSTLASGFVGRFAQRLIRLPETLISITSDLVALDTNALTEEALQSVQTLRLSSIHNLSPQDPFLHSLNELPTAPGVHRHSIIGNRGRKGPVEKSSDGVVPYTSSHLDNVDSELIVPGDHGAYKTPEALAEIMRILQLP